MFSVPGRQRSLVDVGSLILWPDPKAGPWCFIGHWSDIDGRPECVGLEVWKGVSPRQAQNPRGVVELTDAVVGLGGTDLRLPLSQILRALWTAALLSEIRWRIGVQKLQGGVVNRAKRGELTQTEAADLLREMDDAIYSPLRFWQDGPSRKKSDDADHFQAVAEIYNHASRNRLPPTKAVQEHFHVSHSTATKWVHRARHGFGLLPETTPGRATVNRTEKGS
jgi:hypothetical protein